MPQLARPYEGATEDVADLTNAAREAFLRARKRRCYTESMTALTPALSQLSDLDLLAQIQLAARAERHATARLIALLIELDSRRLYLGEGYSSLFSYCTQALHLSEHASYNRIEAARAARRFPVILELIEQGAVTLTTVRLLAPHLTAENHREILDRARHKNKREVELLVATLAPRPDSPAVIRKLPTRGAAPAALPSMPPMGRLPENESPAEAPTARAPVALCEAVLQPNLPSASAAPARESAQVKPLAPERYKIQFTVGRETHDKLRRAQDLLRHSVPSGDPAVIFDRALELLVAQLEQRKAGATARPRAPRPVKTPSRHIPASVRRTVWQRDVGRCAFNGANGRCTETGFLEYHHVVPFAAGGEASAANLELRCRAHNQHEAEQYFGMSRVPQLAREDRATY